MSPAAPALKSMPAADTRSPFVRLTDLLEGVEPGKPPISLAVGEPQHPIPSFVGPILQANLADFGKYPPNKGSNRFCEAAAGWLNRRFNPSRPVDPVKEVVVLSGTREGLFLAVTAAKRHVKPRAGKPAVLVPNPFYAVYSAAAVAADCEPVYMPATAASGFLPDLDSLSDELLARTVAFFLASPANPQGAVADRAYLTRLIGMARRHGFMLFADECYSEIYTQVSPPGMLQVTGDDFSNVVVFHSLSKRSSLAGLRVGFAAGDAAFIKPYLDLRTVSAPQVPLPAQEVAIAAYNDEAHVIENRAMYAAKFDLADQIIGDRFGYKRPAGGFFLWLDVSKVCSDPEAALRLWREAGVRVVPGSYLARAGADGSNPGDGYLRIAMVQNREITAEALHRLVAVLEQ
ncbi:LL-diaminopimelate aminotransferase [Variibacter gotjawalensis]|uniref:Aminotransferase n=1 Tax=Variibacter gotjawalensis TaxID=1333996 RepID=A0A0S3PQQ1_9BRAD|nr:aminotransferase class I/II-fold pyridoxal phosphate-dependent enzyme [Variibacter gotjawalensis]NIK48508.1 aspartate/methionine/tyrosine aminotransferase [Variibacter gotjawalensis]RZS50373.1 succinyldiaminopimelate aminotransferase [Variibacter gotjawalensis]BAT58208.1 LL-diaminopimelate aminotransferase [Variibacter gotjawalensis]